MEWKDIIERTATTKGEARIIMTSSEGYKLATKFDYAALTQEIPDDGTSIFHLWRSFRRYCNSKLGVIYLALDLDRQLRSRGVTNVRVNACHPVRAPTTEIGDFQQTFMSPTANRWVKWMVTLGYNVGNTVEDCAKTQTFLSASRKVREDRVGGEYWVPRINWRLRYVGCQKEELNALGKNEAEWKRMWEFCEEAVRKASSSE
jgi:NAD(P)-dependent dehydrogenase (short-subunit alcohol dehydrogenase family)